jgi:hypothetical protein
MTKKQEAAQLEQEMGQLQEEQKIVDLVNSALTRRRPALVYGIAKMFLEKIDASQFENKEDIVVEGEWMPVESLSQLRALVGGRFKNLKEKLTSAGLPLREHRGDREASAEIDQQGWVELSLWIAKQGFETRLVKSSNSENTILFDVKKQASN